MSQLFNGFVDPEKFNNARYRSSNKFIGYLLEVSTAIFQEEMVNKTFNKKDLNYKIEIGKNLKELTGAKSEIDVWVDININDIYSSLVLFECKNLKNKVEKKEVGHFKDKVREINKLVDVPVRGIFIAKSFTKDALLACNSKEDNVKSLIVSELPYNDKKDISLSYYQVDEIWYNLWGKQTDGTVINLVGNADTIPAFGKIYNIQDFIKEAIESKGLDLHIKNEIKEKNLEGNFEVDTFKEIDLDAPVPLTVPVEKILFEVQFKGYYSKSIFVCKYDFEQKGHILILELKRPDGKVLPMTYHDFRFKQT